MAKHDIDDWILDETELAEHYRATGKVEYAEDKMELVGYLEQLKEYQQLEEQGRLIKLPCKVEDTVYIIIAKSISKQKVKEIIIDGYGIKFKTNRRMFGLCDVFHTVFLAQPEAEAKLKELRCNND